MGAATKVEEAIAHSERQRFDLAALVRAAVAAYGGAFPQRRFCRERPDEPLEIDGAPDLIVQLLDKLIDNAVDFSADGATISVVLRAERSGACSSVANPGPPLPPEARGQAVRVPVAIARRGATNARTSGSGSTSCGSSPNSTAGARRPPRCRVTPEPYSPSACRADRLHRYIQCRRRYLRHLSRD